MAFKFPWTNFHELNLDWVLKKLEELFNASAENVETIESYEGRLTTVEGEVVTIGGNAAQALQIATAAQSDVVQAQQTATQALGLAQTAQSTAAGAINASGTAIQESQYARQEAQQALYVAQNTAGQLDGQIAALQAESERQQQLIEDKGDEVIASIPSDYTELEDEVSDLKSALTYKTDNVYGGEATSINLLAIGGKTWHATLGTMVNTSNRAASNQIKYTPDMKQFDVPSAYWMIIYGNDDGIGHALTQVSSTGVITFSMADFAYKYIYVVLFRQDQAEISSDLTDVLSVSKYNSALKFALASDLESTTEKIVGIKEDLFNAEKTTGYINLNLHTDNLINKGVSGTTGLPAENNETRICNKEAIAIVPNVPIYYQKTVSGYFNPVIYYFKGGVFQGYDTSFASGKSYDADSARFLFFKNPTSEAISPQDVVDNFTLWQESQTSYNNRIKALEGGNDYSLIAYGDSLTTGAGATDSAHTYWAVCAAQLNMKNRIGFGFGGSQSKAIAFTAGGLTGYIPPNTRSFAIKYADLLSDVTIAANALNGKIVIIDGNEYTIGQTGVTTYTLPNDYSPADIYMPVVVKNSRYTADVYVIWMGTNDGAMQWDIVDAMIAKLPHKKFVVMGLTRLGTDTTVEDEAKAYTKYGSHYFNTRVQIINNAFAVLGTTPTAEDETAISSGLIPPSLLSDSTHFNDSGYEVIGKLLAMHIKSLGYTFQIA